MPLMCMHPYMTKDCIEVPCGRCRACRKRRADIWSVRLQHEMCYQEKMCFLTLTYDDEVRLCDYSLKKRDAQLFMKRLRKKFGFGIKYYLCGEYGGRYSRPHYHAIVFGVGIEDEAGIAEAWGLGGVHVGYVDIKSIKYVCKYISKAVLGKVHRDRWLEQNGKREIPFALMSKGIGKQWLLDNASKVILDGGLMVRGKLHAMPRYYHNMVKDSISCDKKAEIQNMMEKKENESLKRRGIKEADAGRDIVERRILKDESIKFFEDLDSGVF